jgi:hypothetical protein
MLSRIGSLYRYIHTIGLLVELPVYLENYKARFSRERNRESRCNNLEIVRVLTPVSIDYSRRYGNTQHP